MSKLGTVYPIYYDSFTCGNFLAYFINKHFEIDNEPTLEIHTTINNIITVPHIKTTELISSNRIAHSIELKAQRSGRTYKQVAELIKRRTANGSIDIDKELQYEKLAGPMLFHEPVFFDKYIVDNKWNTVKPIRIMWTENDTFLIDRMIIGHNVKNKEEYLLNNIPSSSNALLFDIRIQKILDYDETEYNKLIKFIDTPKLNNWPDLVYNYIRKTYVQI